MQFRKLYERSKMKKTKNRILFISLAMMLALTMGLTGCALSQGEAQILSEGLTGGAVAAMSTGSNNTEGQSQAMDRYQALLDRACAIYKEKTGTVIDSEQLKDALDQAQGELQEEALETRLQNLVDEGKLTQEQADQYLEWWQSRPDIEVPLPGLGGPGPGGGMMQGRGFGPRGGPCPGLNASAEAGA
jgi:hypothetical protein